MQATAIHSIYEYGHVFPLVLWSAVFIFFLANRVNLKSYHHYPYYLVCVVGFFIASFFYAASIVIPHVSLLHSFAGIAETVSIIAIVFIQFIGKDKLKNRERKLIALQNIGTKANSTLDLNQIAKLTLDEILQALRFDGLAVYLASKQGNYLELLGSTGLFKETDADISILPSEKLFQKLNETAHGFLDVCNIGCNANIANIEFCNIIKEVGAKNAFAIELEVQQEPIGVMILASRDKIELAPEKIDFIRSAATWLSIAISNARLYEDLRTAYLKIAISFSKAIETRDHYTSGHSDNVAKLSAELASRLGLSKHEIEKAYIGGRLHDIGKIGISSSILKKPGSLTDDEYSVMKEHTFKGFEITEPINSLIKISDIIMYHHERYDGKGYPLSLEGNKIPLLARIAAIADAYDAMTSSNSYREGMSSDKALEIIEQNKGTQFDPAIATHFIEMMKEKKRVKDDFLISNEELKALLEEEFMPGDKAS